MKSYVIKTDDKNGGTGDFDIAIPYGRRFLRPAIMHSSTVPQKKTLAEDEEIASPSSEPKSDVLLLN